MVGVPGKYKGCNTCRARRVKCDNARPLCRKCLDSGRECQGYQRETIFIVGTPLEKGRCSSHPPRNLKSPKSSPSPPRMNEEPTLDLTVLRPFGQAWDDVIFASRCGTTHQLRVAALHMPLDIITRIDSGDESSNVNLSLPPYAPIDVQPKFQEEDFMLRAQCLVHFSTTGKGSSSNPPTAESVLLFLFEQNTSMPSLNLPVWKDSLFQESRVKQMGPRSFTTFPAHHFYARIYRPNAITMALLNRRPTFCSAPEWVTVPWERHPKGAFDRLLDIISQIPSLLQRVDHLIGLEPAMECRLLARDLLEACLHVQTQLEQWYTTMHHAIYRSQSAYWISPDQRNAEIPFTDVLAFRDNLTALTFLYYWTVQVHFYPCIELLSHTITAPLVDAYSQVYEDIPVHLHIDPDAYGPNKLREIATNICRGLDFALNTTTQPDMLALPVQVAETFYRGLNVVAAETGDGALELMWLGGFRGRMVMRGQDVAYMAMGRSWKDLAEW